MEPIIWVCIIFAFVAFAIISLLTCIQQYDKGVREGRRQFSDYFMSLTTKEFKSIKNGHIRFINNRKRKNPLNE